MGQAKRSARACSEIFIRDENIAKIEGLENSWMFVEWLRLDDNEISQIDGLGKCKYLTFLNLNFNDIAEISPKAFDGLQNLKLLDLGNNQIQKM